MQESVYATYFDSDNKCNNLMQTVHEAYEFVSGEGEPSEHEQVSDQVLEMFAAGQDGELKN